MNEPVHDDSMESPTTADLATARATPAAPAMTAEPGATGTDDADVIDDGAMVTLEGDAGGTRDDADESDGRGPLLADEELEGYRSRWQGIQVRFVDEPRDTVKEADGLVAELMQRLAQTFAEERAALEGQWERGGDASTEDLRIALQRYRSFFDRLLAA